jgi:primosomal protein N''
MAQWTGQFSGFTHETKVQDVEHSLRQAITTFQALSEAERSGKLKAIRHLAERLLAVRLKALRARIYAVTEPGSKSLDDTKAAHLRMREHELQAQSADDILREFDFYDKSVA